MSKDKLIVEECREGFYVAWWIADEQEEGASLGDGGSEDIDDAADEHGIASRTAAMCNPSGKMTFGGFYWETKSAALKAKRAADAALTAAKSAKPD